MAADHHESAGHLRLDALRQADRAIALSREVALQADDIRIERAAEGQSLLLAVDAHVEHAAFVTVPLQTCRNADRAERLDKRQHFQTEDSANGRLEERNLHSGCEIVPYWFCLSAVTSCLRIVPRRR